MGQRTFFTLLLLVGLLGLHSGDLAAASKKRRCQLLDLSLPLSAIYRTTPKRRQSFRSWWPRSTGRT